MSFTIFSQIKGHLNMFTGIFKPLSHGLSMKKGSQFKRKSCWCFLASTHHPIMLRCSKVQNASKAPLQKVYMELIQLWHQAFLWTLIMVASKAWTIFLSTGFTNSQVVASGLLISLTFQKISLQIQSQQWTSIFSFLSLFNQMNQVNSIKAHCKCAALLG